MKITYRREMKHNYMIIDPEMLVWKNYECRMLTSNTVEGVLRFQIRQIDDEIHFYYEITSKQPLSRLLENKTVKTEELRCLILGISAVLDRMEIYLLREGCVLLDPDYIYIDPEDFRIWLCLVPGLERNFPEDYGKLLEYLLGKVDHQDKESVVLAYGMYQETRKENYGMQDILRLLYTEHDEDREKRLHESNEGKLDYEDKESQQAKILGTDSKTKPKSDSKINPVYKRSAAKQKSEHKEKISVWEQIRAWWKKIHENSDETDTGQVPWEMMFYEEDADQQIQSKLMPQQACVRPVAQDTVLLADFSGKQEEKEHRLCALEDGLEDIVLSYYPFIIGKQENLVDYILDRETVSRLHLRIDREKNCYYVQDLNSTNGTTVGGILLENNDTAELHEGNEICISKYRYRFM